MKATIAFIFVCLLLIGRIDLQAQTKNSQGELLAPTPPMGWMTWNSFADKIHEKDIMEMAEAMVSSGMVAAGYDHIFIDDGWQGGRDNRNNLIPDPAKFPSGIKALADFVHSKGIKLGIYSDAAPLTCAGYTASLHFEDQDAKTFAKWEVDYLKYDYCGAPEDSATAKIRYKTMGDALRKSGRDIAFGICEWGDRKPWLWAANAGGQLWRTTADVRDKWKMKKGETWGHGIMDILEENAVLDKYAGPGRWNDPDMLIVGLYGKKGPSSDGGGTGCTDTEYQSQMSLWSIMCAPLIATSDLRHMNENTSKIFLNKDVIAINQDKNGIQAERKINEADWSVFLKPLTGGDFALAILNKSEAAKDYTVLFSALGLEGNYNMLDVWSKKNSKKNKQWKGKINSHETRMFRLTKS